MLDGIKQFFVTQWADFKDSFYQNLLQMIAGGI